MNPFARMRLTAAALAGLGLASCAGPVLEPYAGGPAQPPGLVVVGFPGEPTRPPIRRFLPDGACRVEPRGYDKPPLHPLMAPLDRIDGVLDSLLADSLMRDRWIDVLVVLCDRLDAIQISRPSFGRPWSRRDSAASAGVADSALADLDGLYDARTTEFETTFGADVLERFWIAPVLRVRTRVGAIDSIAAWPGVAYVQAAHGTNAPPGSVEVDDGARLVNAHVYRAKGLPGPWFGLFDTGVRATHVLLDAPGRITRNADCTGPENADCTGPGTSGTADLCPEGHGTSSAAILVGDGDLGQDYEGLTTYPLASYQVYEPGSGICGAALDPTAALRAFQHALLQERRVLVAEMQSETEHYDALARAADAAYDAGAVVVAANGNTDEVTDVAVASPASARKVLGVGAVDVLPPHPTSILQCTGPTPDGRLKPDIQAPTSTNTAGNESDTAIQTLSATSGATPYAAGAAALAWAWLERQLRHVDPGQVYAHLILAGRLDPSTAGRGPASGRAPVDQATGAGPISLPIGGACAFGKVLMHAPRQVCTVVLDPPRGTRSAMVRLDAALWWPEEYESCGIDAGPRHNDLDLEIRDRQGALVAAGRLTGSVFERVWAEVEAMRGPFRLRIVAYDLPHPVQPAYWSALARPAPRPGIQTVR